MTEGSPMMSGLGATAALRFTMFKLHLMTASFCRFVMPENSTLAFMSDIKLESLICDGVMK